MRSHGRNGPQLRTPSRYSCVRLPCQLKVVKCVSPPALRGNPRSTISRSQPWSFTPIRRSSSAQCVHLRRSLHARTDERRQILRSALSDRSTAERWRVGRSPSQDDKLPAGTYVYTCTAGGRPSSHRPRASRSWIRPLPQLRISWNPGRDRPHGMGRPEPHSAPEGGETIFVSGGTGGVGNAACQLAGSWLQGDRKCRFGR